ncbi:putative glycosyltransferase [Trichoderma chlorosporum]
MVFLSSESRKPLLVFFAHQTEGHINPILTIASYMVQRGYDVSFVCPERYKKKITNAGAEFIDMPDLNHHHLAPPELAQTPYGLERLVVQLTKTFYETTPVRAERALEVLQLLRRRDPERQIIILEEIFSMATMALKYGCPLPVGFDTLPKRIGINPSPLMVESQDTAPFMLALPPDSTESGRLRNKELRRLVNKGPMRPLSEAWAAAMSACNCEVVPDGDPLSAWYTNYDATFMLCSPSLEYPLSDMPSMIDFAGCLPRQDISADYKYPAWWSEVTENAVAQDRKKILFVSQGTMNNDWQELIFPAIYAFSGHDDILVIASLGARGSKLPDHIKTPKNVRVIDYIPYDLVLEHSDVFISNAGYGAFCHAVINGVPAVFAGESEEKAEVTMRATWAGFALSLKTQTPTWQQVKEGVQRVLGDEIYKRRAGELRRENEALDALARIEQKIIDFTDEVI